MPLASTFLVGTMMAWAPWIIVNLHMSPGVFIATLTATQQMGAEAAELSIRRLEAEPSKGDAASGLPRRAPPEVGRASSTDCHDQPAHIPFGAGNTKDGNACRAQAARGGYCQYGRLRQRARDLTLTLYP